MYAFTPNPFLPKVLAKMQADQASMILITTLWPQQSWYPHILLLSQDMPTILPLFPHLLSQTLMDEGQLFHQDNTTLPLVVQDQGFS